MVPAAARSFAPSAERGGPLDLLRFAAAILIVLYHYAVAAPVDVTRLHPALTRGYLATDFFLILSGYVLAKAYGRRLLEGRSTALQVVSRRWRRIWPGHAVMMLTFLAFVTASTALGHAPNRPLDYQPADFLAQLFLVQAWGAPVGTGWNFPTWSLSALFVCYAVFPFAWRLAARSPAAGVAAAGLLLVMAVDAWAEVALGGPMFQLPYFLGVVRALPLFLFGLGLARVTEDHPVPRAWADAVWTLALAGLAAVQLLGRGDLVSMVLIGLIIVGCGSIQGRRGSPVGGRGARLCHGSRRIGGGALARLGRLGPGCPRRRRPVPPSD